MNRQRIIKLVLLGMAIWLPTLFGIICGWLKVLPVDSADRQVYGSALLPEILARAPGIQLFAFALLCAMVIITAILAGIALNRRMSNRALNK